eukprot:CAMPEP_0196824138 /NCGR_PEP_ID=MMETSP1362-20130617/90604_1 /TAXON_ID=163516 /ORGANISM="Leptocylindrus danicus, Strain CCMP1856" /LENGTH=231 /DNA_ID=CAMNT_0042204293 /DNA_START=85 /DNA_END=780 /DNA_ORIENTATION=+
MPKHGVPPTTRSNNIDSTTPIISTRKVTALDMVLPCDLISASSGDVVTVSTSASSMLVSSLTDTIFTPDSIKGAFNVATFLPQPFWLLPILLPKADITKKLFGDFKVITLFCLVHFFIVTASILQPDGTAPMAEFADVFDPSGNPQAAMVGMMQYPNFVSEEWSHVLTWDLFVGRWIWLDGLKRGVFASHSVLLCNLIGPPGLLLHLATCLVTGKGLPGNEIDDADEDIVA